jgi:hypothetical protein
MGAARYNQATKASHERPACWTESVERDRARLARVPPVIVARKRRVLPLVSTLSGMAGLAAGPPTSALASLNTTARPAPGRYARRGSLPRWPIRTCRAACPSDKDGPRGGGGSLARSRLAASGGGSKRRGSPESPRHRLPVRVDREEPHPDLACDHSSLNGSGNTPALKVSEGREPCSLSTLARGSGRGAGVPHWPARRATVPRPRVRVSSAGRRRSPTSSFRTGRRTCRRCRPRAPSRRAS